MAEFTLHDLKDIMRACAGVADSVDLDSDIGRMKFSDLGYDSLALMEIQARIQQEYGVLIPDDGPELLDTPQAMVEFANGRMQGPASA